MPQVSMAKALNIALREELLRDDSVVLLGQDIGKRGGVFLVTEGLYEEFGSDRVIDTPLSESGIVGMAIGMAMYGLRPVAEIQFVDFGKMGYDEILNQLAKIRYRSAGQFTSPVVLRAPSGAGVRGGLYHSQSPEAIYAHAPGLRVAIPSSPYDAKGLLKTAIRGDDPVIFLEPKLLYRTPREEVPENDYTIPFGQARILRKGDHVSVITYGTVVYECVKAADEAAKKGVESEVIDLRTVIPIDIETILTSVKKTGRVVIVHDAPKTGGFGAEISALLAEKAIEYLAAPIVRVTGPSVPMSPVSTEELYMPASARILRGIQKVAQY